MTGPAIARTLGMARSTVGLVLRRLGLGKLKALEPKAAVIRYEHAASGAMTSVVHPRRPFARQAETRRRFPAVWIRHQKNAETGPRQTTLG